MGFGGSPLARSSNRNTTAWHKNMAPIATKASSVLTGVIQIRGRGFNLAIMWRATHNGKTNVQTSSSSAVKKLTQGPPGTRDTGTSSA